MRGVDAELRDVAPGLWTLARRASGLAAADSTGSRSSPRPASSRAARSLCSTRSRRRTADRGVWAAARRAAADARGRPQARPRPRRRPVRRALRRPRVRAVPLLARRHPRDRARADRAGRASCPAGLVALYDGRGRNETPLWLPEQRALVFADALTAPAASSASGTRRGTRSARCPALRELLELPFEHVIVSHGEPVHDRAAFERALELAAVERREAPPSTATFRCDRSARSGTRPGRARSRAASRPRGRGTARARARSPAPSSRASVRRGRRPRARCARSPCRGRTCGRRG